MKIREKISNSKVLPAILILTTIGLISFAVINGDQGSYLSSSQVEYSSNGFFDGEQLVINYQADQSTEQLDVFWEASELQEETGDDIAKSVSVEVVEQNSYVRYNFRDTGQRDIVSIEPIHKKFDIGYYEDESDVKFNQMFPWFEEKCMDVDGDGSVSGADYSDVKETDNGGYGNHFDAYCVTVDNHVASVGDFTNKQVVGEWTFEITSGDTTETITLSSSDIGEGATYQSGDIAIKFVQGIPTMQNAYSDKQLDDELVAQDSRSQDWSIINANRYQDWIQELESSSGLRETIDDWAEGSASRTDVAEINNEASRAVEPYAESPLTGTEFIGSDIRSGFLKAEPRQGEVVWGEFLINARGGDFVEVKKPVGDPEIQNVEATDIQEIGAGTVTASVENLADGPGSFDARITSCSNEFQYTGGFIRQEFDAGETKDFTFNVGFQADGSQDKIDGSCVVEVENSEGDTVSSQVDLVGNQEATCTGDRFKDVVDGKNAIVECQDDGQPGEVIEYCEFGFTRESGELVCAPDPGNEESGPTDTDTTDSCVRTLYDSPLGEQSDIEFRDPFCEISKLWDSAVSAGEKMWSIATIFAALIGGVLSLRLGQRVFNIPENLDERVQRAGEIIFALGGIYFTYHWVNTWYTLLLTILAGLAYAYLKGLLGPYIELAKQAS